MRRRRVSKTCTPIQVCHGLSPSLASLSSTLFLVFRPKLQSRLAKLEKQLKIPPEDRHVPEPGLANAQEIFIFGTRIRHSTSALHLDNMMRPKNMISSHFPVVRSSGRGGTQVQVPLHRCRLLFHCLTPVQQVLPVKNVGKSCWKGKADGEVVNVEAFALQHYEDEGWKGYVAFLPR